MRKLAGSTVLGGGLIALAFAAGCSSEPQGTTPAASTGTAAAPSSTDSTDSAPAMSEEQTEISQAMAKLPEDDRRLAVAQKVCPVSDQPLGSMGTPIKVTVDGKSLFICCEGCEQDARENIDAHLAKLGGSADAAP